MTLGKLALYGAGIYVLAWINPLLGWAAGVGLLVSVYRRQRG